MEPIHLELHRCSYYTEYVVPERVASFPLNSFTDMGLLENLLKSFDDMLNMVVPDYDNNFFALKTFFHSPHSLKIAQAFNKLSKHGISFLPPLYFSHS